MARTYKKKVQAKVTASASLSVSGEVRTNLALQLFKPASLFFMHGAGAIEAAGIEGRKLEDRMLALGCVLASVAYLESYINAVYIMASEPSGIGNLPAEICKNLSDTWASAEKNRGFKSPRSIKSQTLRKYHKAAVHITGKNPKWPDGLLEDARDLIRLRNELVHYSAFCPSKRPPKLEAVICRIKPKFAPNPFYLEPANEFWPKGVLGFGCASWAANTAEAVVDWFKGLMRKEEE